MATNNPWRGLASYKDPSMSESKYLFCGRSEDTVRLTSLIDNNLFVTLYGRTGVGKTSLLNAGVFPVLREQHYFPISVRLSQESTNITYAQAIVAKIKQSGLTIIDCGAPELPNADDGTSSIYLWNYFGRTKFCDKNGHSVFPVIVLDQFEEIFFSERGKADLLLMQINHLLSDDLITPTGYSDKTNYRFVASIREDNLYMLEDSIDSLALSLYKENRYRLRPLSKDNARRAILEPGENCVDRKHADEIADRIIESAIEPDGTISTLILSLTCNRMYGQAEKHNGNQPCITLQIAPKSSEDTDRILHDFYMESTTKKQRRVIEEHYLTDDGHRKPSCVKIPNVEKLTSIESRLLQNVTTDGGEKVEIVHDRLAKVIYMQRRKRDEHLYRRLQRVVILCLLAIVFGSAVKLSWTSETAMYNPLAKYTGTIPTSVCNITAKHDTTQLSKNIKQVHIGDSVESIANIDYWHEGLEIIVSPKNKTFGVGKFHKKYDGVINYLYYKNDPNTAIYMQQKNDDYSHLRLPKEVKFLKWKGNAYRHSEGAPYYGETEVAITSDEYNFTGDDKIVNIKFTEDISEYEYAEINNFDRCKNLKTVDLRNVNNVGSNAFALNYSLESVVFPKKIRKIGVYAFLGCCNLRDVTLPEEIEDTTTLSSIFKCCPYIENITLQGRETLAGFHYDADSVLYYGKTPVIFNKCTREDWCSVDPVFFLSKGVVCRDSLSNAENIIPRYFIKSNSGYNNHSYNGNLILLDKTFNDSVLYISSEYGILGNISNVKELHILNPNYDIAKITVSGEPFSDKEKRNIILYVPYGVTTMDFYRSDSNWKDIRNDSMWKRVSNTINYWTYGIIYNFISFGYIFYPLIAVGLLFVWCVIYKLKLRQQRVANKVNKMQAATSSILGVIMAAVGFIPFYWITYVYFIFHCTYSETLTRGRLPQILGCVMGCLAAYFTAYLFVFAGNGKLKILEWIKSVIKGQKVK